MDTFKLEHSFHPKWQKLLNLVSANYNLPTTLIMKLDDGWIKVFMKCNSSDNPYIVGHKEKLDGSYSHEVIRTKGKWLISNSLEDINWCNNSDVKLGMISYLGYPLYYPNGDVFGTICVLDRRKNEYSKEIENLLTDIKKLIELDLKNYFEYEYKRNELEESIINRERLIVKEEELLKLDFSQKNYPLLFNQFKKYPYKTIPNDINYKQLFDKINTAIEVYTLVYNDNHKIVDLRCVDMNPLSEEIRQISRNESIGKTLLEIFPDTNAELFSHFDKINKLNETHDFHIFCESLKKHLSCSVFKMQNNTYILTYYDITNRIEFLNKLKESEKRYKTIFQNSGLVMMIINPSNGEIVDVNRAAINYTGYERNKLLSMTIDQINISNKNDITKEMQKVANHEKYYFEFRYRVASGEIRNVEVYSSPFEENGIKLLYSIIFDVTKKNKALNNVLKLSSIIERSPVSVIITNIDGKIIYTNKQNEFLTGYSSIELLGKNPRILKSGKTNLTDYEKLWKNILNGKVWRGEFYNKRKNGSYYWEFSSITPISDSMDGSVNFVKVGIDITARKEVEKDLNQAKIKAEESDRLKTSFLSNLSHEIRTPLNGILGFSELLQIENLSSEKRKMYGDIVNASGQQLLMIISDLVRSSDIESGTLSIKNSKFHVGELIKEVRDFHIRTCEMKGINLLIRHDSYACSDFISDRKRIRQILDNLMNNAIKFTANGTIELATKCSNGSILFSVRDTGIGISKENQKIIFERFMQVEDDESFLNNGNGLGLYINKEVVKLLGGEMWVESEIGKGSTFKFTVKKRKKLDF